MNYPLAKKLKDAGLEWSMSHYFYDGNEHECTSDMYPTLSELIEACGDKFHKLIRDGIGLWSCTARVFTGFDSLAPNLMAKTPEEAVANLWLILNKKEDVSTSA